MLLLFISLLLIPVLLFSNPVAAHVEVAHAHDAVQIVEVSHGGVQQVMRRESSSGIISHLEQRTKTVVTHAKKVLEKSSGLHQDVLVGAAQDMKDLLQEPDCPTMLYSLFSSVIPPRAALWQLKHRQMMPLEVADQLLALERDHSSALEKESSRQLAGEWVLAASVRCSFPDVCRAVSKKLLTASETECPRGRLLHQVQKQLEANWRHTSSPFGQSPSASTMRHFPTTTANLTSVQLAIAHWGASLLDKSSPSTMGSGLAFLAPPLVPPWESGQEEIAPWKQVEVLLNAASEKNSNLRPAIRSFLLAADKHARQQGQWNPSIILMRLLVEQRAIFTPQDLVRDAAVVNFYESRVSALEKDASAEPVLHDTVQRGVQEQSSQLELLSQDHALALPDDMGVIPAFWIGRVARVQRKLEGRLLGLNTTKPTVLIWTCSFGGGHRAVTKALQGYLSADYRTIVVDPTIDKEFFEGDTTGELLRDYISPLFNSTYFFNEIVLRDKRYEFENAMETFEIFRNQFWHNRSTRFSAPCAAPGCDYRLKRLMRRAMLRTAPDAIITVYHMDLMPIMELAQEQGGVPLMHLATDMDAKMWEVFEVDPTFPDLRIGVPFDLPQAIETVKPLAKERVFVSGYPVRPSFLIPLPTAEGRLRLRRPRGIQANASVVLIMSGSAGQAVPWPMMLSESATYNSTSPMHVVVVVGKNSAYAAELESHFDTKEIVGGHMICRSTAKPGFSLEVAADPHFVGSSGKHKEYFVSESELVSLMDLSDVLISKPGGSTSAEAAYRGLPLLFDAADGMMHWEAFTANVFDKHKRAKILHNPSDLEIAMNDAARLGRDTSLTYINGRPANASEIIRRELVEMHACAQSSRSAVPSQEVLFSGMQATRAHTHSKFGEAAEEASPDSTEHATEIEALNGTPDIDDED